MNGFLGFCKLRRRRRPRAQSSASSQRAAEPEPRRRGGLAYPSLVPSWSPSEPEHEPFRLLQLPEEIIALILEMVPDELPDFDTHSSLFPPALLWPGGVCSDLRRIWLLTPRCWTRMFFCLTTQLTTSPGHLKLHDLFLTRSRQCLIDLRLRIALPNPDTLYNSQTAAQTFLLSSLTRCRSLGIRDDERYYPRSASLTALSPESMGHLPHLPHLAKLAKLELIVTFRLLPSHFYHPNVLLASCDPQVLRYLRIDYASSDAPLCASPEGTDLWTGLRELQLRDHLEARTWSMFIQRCPNLEHLLWASRPLWNEPELDWNMSLPHLKTLKILRQTPNLDELHAPELVELRIQGEEDAFTLFPSLWTLGQLPSLPRARFPSLRRLTIPGFNSASRERFRLNFQVLFHVLCTTVEELIILPRDYSSPTLEALEAICDVQEELEGRANGEETGIGEGPNGLKLRYLVVTYYPAGPKRCHCGWEFQMTYWGKVEILKSKSARYSRASERRDVTHSFKRFLDTFPSAQLSICSCCESPAGLGCFLDSLPESQRARVDHHFYRANSGRVGRRTGKWFGQHISARLLYPPLE